jgi:hypothetical protein
MSKWPMRGHFEHLHFKTFPMTPRTPQGEVFCPLLSNSKNSGAPEDSKSPTLGVWVSSSHLAKVGLRHIGHVMFRVTWVFPTIFFFFFRVSRWPTPSPAHFWRFWSPWCIYFYLIYHHLEDMGVWNFRGADRWKHLGLIIIKFEWFIVTYPPIFKCFNVNGGVIFA